MSEDELHFEEEDWLDLALRLVPTEHGARMRSHLERGCTDCARLYSFWKAVAEAAAQQHLYEPPRDVVQSEKAAFPLAQKLPLLPRVAQSARILFDSFYEPVPAGVRGGTTGTRHLLYETDDFLIDLLVEVEGDKRMALAGQILPKSPSRPRTGEVGVLAASNGGRTLRHAAVNAHGEFQIEGSEPGGLDLYVQLPDSTIKHISIPAPT